MGLRGLFVRAGGVLAAGAAVASCGNGTTPVRVVQPRESTVSTSPAAAMPCQPAVLRLKGGRQGGGFQTAHADLEITNAGSSPIFLGAPRGIRVLDARRHRLPIQTTSPTDATSTTGIQLPDHGIVMLVLSWENWCGERHGSLRIQVQFGDHGTVDGSFNGPPDYDYWPGCINRHQESTLQVLGGYSPA